jgi:hypothetical protein
MRTDDLKIGYWYKTFRGLVELIETGGTLVGVTRMESDGTRFGVTIHTDDLNPATLDDLAVILVGRECWFVTSEVNQPGFCVLDMYSRYDGVMRCRTIGTTVPGWGTCGADYDIALALAAAVHAPVITREQWKELTDE